MSLCQGDVHVFETDFGVPDHIEALPDETPCDCLKFTWGEMNERLFTRTWGLRREDQR